MHNTKRTFSTIFCCMFVVVVSPAAAQNHILGGRHDQEIPAVSTKQPEVPSEAYGGNVQYSVFHASLWTPAWEGTSATWGQPGGYLCTSDPNALGSYWTQLDLPFGASVDLLTALIFDEDPGGGIGFNVFGLESAYPGGTDSQTQLGYAESGFAATPGFTELQVVPDPPLLLRRRSDFDSDGNANTGAAILQFAWEKSATTDKICFWGAEVKWHRTISPAPATATFSDVPTGHWAFQFIEALAASGITAGCGGGNYCPDSPITRAEMAVYLSAALGLHWPQ